MAQFKEKPGDVSMRENIEIERENKDRFDKEREFANPTSEDKYRTYQGMSRSKDYEIIVHSYKDTNVGHFNVEFRSQGKRDAWLGSNVNSEDIFSIRGINGGIYDETKKSILRIDNSPNTHKATILKVSREEYEQALNFAKNKYLDKNQDYDILGRAEHCVSFADKVLKNVNGYGQKGKTLGDMALGNTLAANLARGSYSNGHFESSSLQRDNDRYKETLPQPKVKLSIDAGERIKINMNKNFDVIQQNAIFDRAEKYVVNGSVFIYGNGQQYLYSTPKDDLLAGGDSNDTYFFYKGQGNDIVYDIQGQNSIILMTGNYNRLWFSKERNHLRIRLIDGKSSILYQNYFVNPNVLKGIYSAESKKYITTSSINKLTQSMAAFAIPNSISDMTRLIDDSQTLKAVITTSWV